MNFSSIASRIAQYEDVLPEPPEEPPYESFEEQKLREETRLSQTTGKFLVFFEENGMPQVSISNNLFEAKESSKIHNSNVRELNKGYSPDEFDENIWSSDEFNSDDNFFWNLENHPLVKNV